MKIRRTKNQKLVLPRAKKSYGQNFLVDRNVVGKIIAAAEIVPGEAVLEVGPGTGALTAALVAAGARVTAVEADRDLIPALREKFGDSIDLIQGDIQSYTLPPTRYKLIANIPYNITSELIHRFLTVDHPPARMVLMVQREVADRMAARPPDMSLLSVACQLYAEVARVANVPAGAFRPIPKVDSAVVRLDVRAYPLLTPPWQGENRDGSGVDEGVAEVIDAERIIRLAKAGFSSRRKQLHGNLAGAGLATSADAKAALVALGLPATARAENLSVHNWIRLAGLL